MEKLPYNSYARYIKKTFGQRVQKISIDAGFTCPNRDGSAGVGGCTFCNNDSFSHFNNSTNLNTQIADSITHYQKFKPELDKFFVYFQSYSNTYAPLKELEKLYLEALEHPNVIGLCIGTRADCIDKEKISFLEELAKTYDITIEYGLESTSDETLKKINRGHDLQCFKRALDMTHGRDIKICSHLILGFPWEDEKQMIESADFMSGLPIDFLKLHQLHIVKQTKMGNDYIKKPFKLLNQDEYFHILKEFLIRLRGDIVLQRFFGNAPKELMLSPHWEESISELNNRLIKEMTNEGLSQGMNFLK